MKTVYIIILSIFISNYSNAQVEILHYHTTYENLYQRAKKLLNIYSKNNLNRPAKLSEIECLTKKINDMLIYLGIYKLNKSYTAKEIKYRIKAIEMVIKQYGLKLNIHLVNQAYLRLLHQDSYIVKQSKTTGSKNIQYNISSNSKRMKRAHHIVYK
ncbi:MAG: hypothetical protein GY810_05720 [Aureispira sp.]|nr:hypothetical protein [Aureispira sp.]